MGVETERAGIERQREQRGGGLIGERGIRGEETERGLRGWALRQKDKG